jgi:hypothetical protein
MIQATFRRIMNRRAFLKTSSTAAGVIAVNSQLSEPAVGQSVDETPTFRRPKTLLPVPTPSPQFQRVETGVPDTQLTREATGQEIAEAFFHGFEHKPETTEYTCNEDICSHFIRNYRRRNFYDQVQNSPFQNS